MEREINNQEKMIVNYDYSKYEDYAKNNINVKYGIGKIKDKYIITVKSLGQIERLDKEFDSVEEAKKVMNDLIRVQEVEKARKVQEQKQLEKENNEYAKKMKIDKVGSKKNNKIVGKVLLGTAIVVALATGTVTLVNGCSPENTLSNTSTITVEATPTATPIILDQVEVVETPAPIVESMPTVETLAPTVEPIKEMTHEEKIEFIKENAENFKNEMNAIDNIKIDNNDALLELCYINGINPYELNVSTADVVLDAVSIYGNYLDKTFTNAKNYLGYNTELRGQNNIYTDVFSKYICDITDREIYSEIINKALVVVNGCYTLTKEEALEKSYEYNTVLANDIIADEYYENCSTPIQTLILSICYHSPEMLPENTRINIDTPIGVQQLENINNIKDKADPSEDHEINFMNENESYTNLRNEYNHLYRIATRNATMEFFLAENPECTNAQLSNNDVKKYIKSL